MKKEENTCPCNGNCCENPSVGRSDHECDDKCEIVCEASFEKVCDNCAQSCYCDL